MNEKQGYPSLTMLDRSVYQAVEWEALRHVDQRVEECYELSTECYELMWNGVGASVIN